MIRRFRANAEGDLATANRLLGSFESLGNRARAGDRQAAGIVGFSLLAVKTGIARLPNGVNWLQMLAVGILAGIGFAVSIFIRLVRWHSMTQHI